VPEAERHFAFGRSISTMGGIVTSRTVPALRLALSRPTFHVQQASRQSEYLYPLSAKGSSVSRADVKAEERASGSKGHEKQSEYADTAKRRSGSAAANDSAPASNPFARSREEKAQARNAYKHAKKESVAKLKATHQRSDTKKNMEVPK